MPTAFPADALSNWSHLIENLQSSSLKFFESVEGALAKRAIPNTKVSRIDYREGGIHTAKREYLRITRDKLVFEICAAPYGTGFFISWWLSRPQVRSGPLILLALLIAYLIATRILIGMAGYFLGFLLSIALIPAALLALRWCVSEGAVSDDHVVAIPIVGRLYKRFVRPDTFYAIDTATMFQTAAHAAVLEAVDGLVAEKGVRALSELERAPMVRKTL